MRHPELCRATVRWRAPMEGEVPLFTVIACVTFVGIGIVGAMKMENHLEPRSEPSETRTGSEG